MALNVSTTTPLARAHGVATACASRLNQNQAEGASLLMILLSQRGSRHAINILDNYPDLCAFLWELLGVLDSWSRTKSADWSGMPLWK